MAEKPKRIHVDRAKGWIEMEWPQEGTLQVALPVVRKACPCALCEDLRTEQPLEPQLEMIAPEQMPSVELADVIPVGNYAIQIKWDDGHDTGIYTYSFLKELAQGVSSSDP